MHAKSALLIGYRFRVNRRPVSAVWKQVKQVRFEQTAFVQKLTFSMPTHTAYHFESSHLAFYIFYFETEMACGFPLYNRRTSASRISHSLSTPPTPSIFSSPQDTDSPSYTLQLLSYLSPTLSVHAKHTTVWRVVKKSRILQLRANVVLAFRSCDETFSPQEALLVLPLQSQSRIHIRVHRRSSVFIDGHIFFFTTNQAARTFLAAARDSIAVYCTQPQTFAREKLENSLSVKQFQKSDVFFSMRMLSEVLHQRLFLQAAFYNQSPFLPRLHCANETSQTLSFSVRSLPSFGPLTALLASLPQHRMPLEPARQLFVEMLVALAHTHALGFLLRDVTTDTFTISKTGHARLTYYGLVKLVTTHIPSAPKPHPSASSFPSDITTSSRSRQMAVPDDKVARYLMQSSARRMLRVDRSQSSTISSDLFEKDDLLTQCIVDDMSPDARAKSFVGTRSHMSPEHLNAGHAAPGSYGFAADVWMLGVTLYTMVVGHHPFHDSLTDASKIFEAIRSRQVDIPHDLPDDISTLLQGMLQKDELKRFTIETIMSSAWLRNVNWADLLDSAERNSPVPIVVDLLPISESRCSDISSDESPNISRLSRLSESKEGCKKSSVSLPPFNNEERTQTVLGFDFLAAPSGVNLVS